MSKNLASISAARAMLRAFYLDCDPCPRLPKSTQQLYMNTLLFAQAVSLDEFVQADFKETFPPGLPGINEALKESLEKAGLWLKLCPIVNGNNQALVVEALEFNDTVIESMTIPVAGSGRYFPADLVVAVAQYGRNFACGQAPYIAIKHVCMGNAGEWLAIRTAAQHARDNPPPPVYSYSGPNIAWALYPAP